MNILGLNAYHGDSAAVFVVDGELAAACSNYYHKYIDRTGIDYKSFYRQLNSIIFQGYY